MSSSIKECMNSGITLVNRTNINNFRNKYVIVHGKVQSIKNNILNLLIDPSNNHDILINNFREKVSLGDFIAIIGKVASDKSLDFADLIELGQDFDLEYANEIIPLSYHVESRNFFTRT